MSPKYSLLGSLALALVASGMASVSVSAQEERPFAQRGRRDPFQAPMKLRGPIDHGR